MTGTNPETMTENATPALPDTTRHPPRETPAAANPKASGGETAMPTQMTGGVMKSQRLTMEELKRNPSFQSLQRSE